MIFRLILTRYDSRRLPRTPVLILLIIFMALVICYLPTIFIYGIHCMKLLSVSVGTITSHGKRLLAQGQKPLKPFIRVFPILLAYLQLRAET